jgi:hypothetical protein
MNFTQKLWLWFIWIVLAGVTASTASAQDITVRGRIERDVPAAKKPPVPYIRVTLTPKEAGGASRAAYTDSDGMYYFQRTKPGRYDLKVWGDPKEKKLLFEQECQIAPRNSADRYFDVRPILLP